MRKFPGSSCVETITSQAAILRIQSEERRTRREWMAPRKLMLRRVQALMQEVSRDMIAQPAETPTSQHSAPILVLWTTNNERWSTKQLSEKWKSVKQSVPRGLLSSRKRPLMSSHADSATSAASAFKSEPRTIRHRQPQKSQSYRR